MRLLLRFALFLFFSGSVLTGEVRLPSVFSDHMVLQRDVPVHVWGWALNGERVRVQFAGQEKETYAYENRWEVTLDPLEASGEGREMVINGFNRVVLRDVLVGEVWLASGQSNMRWSLGQTSHAEESLAKAEAPQLRLFMTAIGSADDPQEDVEGAWAPSSAEAAKGFSAVAFLFGLELLATQNVPVGIIQSAVGGTRVVNWTGAAVLAQNPDARGHEDYYRELLRAYPAKLDAWRSQVAAGDTEARPPTLPHRRQPAGYFNAMIHGLVGFPIRGVIWYQGETDTWNAEEYERMFPDMITDWRERWKIGDFPFLYVQLPGFNGKAGADENYPFLREMQRLVEPTRPNLGMAVTIDQGEKMDIHPKEKREVAHRLALLARSEVYGERLVARGPQPAEIRFESAEARVRFSNVADGLEVRGEALRGFALSAAEGVFHPAEAQLLGKDTVVVRSEAVPEPVYLRYGFRGFPPTDLFNSAGLPAVPFRTDNFARSDEAITVVPDR